MKVIEDHQYRNTLATVAIYRQTTSNLTLKINVILQNRKRERVWHVLSSSSICDSMVKRYI